MVAHSSTPDWQDGEPGLRTPYEPGASLIVMHAHESRAAHVLVMDPDLHELDRAGGLLGAQGFKVTLSSTLLDLESLAYFAADLLVLRAPAKEIARWEAYLHSVGMDGRLGSTPVVWLASVDRRAPAPVTRFAHILTGPWTPFDFLTLVDSLVAASDDIGSSPSERFTPGRSFGDAFSAGSD